MTPAHPSVTRAARQLEGTETVLICFEPECDWWTSTPFPACLEELAAHNCGGSHDCA